jgi:uncharacterized protein YdeI (YjbR/CyaY-like superfamily)
MRAGMSAGKEKTRWQVKMNSEKRIHFVTRHDFRQWLEKNHDSDESVWLEFFKDGTEGIIYQEALEEALCFGWIDSLIKRVDDRIYIQKFSKRKPNSKWSELNKKLVQKLQSMKLMSRRGLEAVQRAKENGQWFADNSKSLIEDIGSFRKILGFDPHSLSLYDSFSESLRKHYAGYYFDAKTERTRSSRLEKIIVYMKSKKRIM